MFLVPTPSSTPLKDLPIVEQRQGWGDLGFDRSVGGNPIRMGGQMLPGIGTHANSDLLFLIGSRFQTFSALAGIDDEMKEFAKSSVTFEVLGDGRSLWKSGVMRHGDPPEPCRVDVTGVQLLELKVGDAGDGIDGDHADWGSAVLFSSHQSLPFEPLAATLRSKSISIRVAKDGQIRGIRLGRGAWVDTEVDTALGLKLVGRPIIKQRRGSIAVIRRFVGGQAACELTDRYSIDHIGLRWEQALKSVGPLTTRPIVTSVKLPSPGWRFWAAWNDPKSSDQGLTMGDPNVSWNDPLEAQRFANRSWQYGELPSGNWWSGDIVTLPMFTVIPHSGERALSFIASPSDPSPGARLTSCKDGTVVWSRSHLQLGEGKAYHFTNHLVPHEPEPRAALSSIASAFPDYFRPELLSAGRLGGCAAYSGDERPLSAQEAADLRQMDFKTMWKLSDDYVYMGMFLPPTSRPEVPWNRTPDSGSPAGYKPLATNVGKLDGFGRMLVSNGFHLLDYFNVCEFGVNIKDLTTPVSRGDLRLWPDGSAYLKSNFPSAPIKDGSGKPLPAWQGGWVMDPGDPQYRAHLLRQASLYLDRVPGADGICIDRADYLRLYNHGENDGVSYDDGKARSLVSSWQSLLKPLAGLMHARGKAIFSNFMDPRLDLAQHVDGFYCEFGNQPTVLNGMSFLSLEKPLLLWTRDEDKLTDEFFQRELYLGGFPTAPYPTNNHCIEPSAEHDRWFLEYGPLFAALTDRRWDLRPGCIRLTGSGKANLFFTKKGAAMVLVFCGVPKTALVEVKDPRLTRLTSAYIERPGVARHQRQLIHWTGDQFAMSVPLSKGCAVVSLEP